MPRPSNSIDPAVGGKAPESMLKIVLLPEPFGPIRPRISPCSTSNETRFTAVKPPKRFVSESTTSTAAHPFASQDRRRARRRGDGAEPKRPSSYFA